MENKINLNLDDDDLIIIIHSLKTHIKSEKELLNYHLTRLNCSDSHKDVPYRQKQVKKTREGIQKTEKLIQTFKDNLL
tara:strand:+ start:117 stop:350 length:234 start_codon:yes stop_codon:yes gene_type:complete